MINILSKLYLALYMTTAYISSYKYTRLKIHRYHSACCTSLYSRKSSTSSALSNSTSHELRLDRKSIQSTVNNENQISCNTSQARVRHKKFKVSRYSNSMVEFEESKMEEPDEENRDDDIQAASWTPAQKEYWEAIAAKFTWTGPPPERHGQ